MPGRFECQRYVGNMPIQVGTQTSGRVHNLLFFVASPFMSRPAPSGKPNLFSKTLKLIIQDHDHFSTKEMTHLGIFWIDF